MCKPPKTPKRQKLAMERPSVTHRFVIRNSDEEYVPTGKKDESGNELFIRRTSDLKGYLVVGMYDDGSPGEIFLTIGKAGGVYRVFDALMIAVSIGLQYGVPIEEYLDKFSFMAFEPSGFTKTDGIHITKSVVDYIARWMKQRFPKYAPSILQDEEKDDQPEEDPGEVQERDDQEGESSLI
jgi:hypothetical protein